MRAALATLAIVTSLATSAGAATLTPLPPVVTGDLFMEDPNGLDQEQIRIAPVEVKMVDPSTPSSGWTASIDMAFLGIYGPTLLSFQGAVTPEGVVDGTYRFSGEMLGALIPFFPFFLPFEGETRSMEASFGPMAMPFDGQLNLAADGTWACLGGCTYLVPDLNSEYSEPSPIEVQLTQGTYHIPVAPVPLPATAPLLALGIAGLAALRRRKVA